MSFLGGMVYGSAVWLLHIGSFQGIGYCGKKEWGILGSLAWGNAGIIVAICELERRMQMIPGENRILYTGAEEVLLGLLAGGLLAAAYMDAKSSYVYNYVWWWCLPWACLIALSEGWDIRTWIAAAGFAALQQLVFGHMYGRADCYAFSVCALAECTGDTGILWPLCHMLLAVILLTVVQLFHGNVTLDGRLRVPQPFIPYITVSFWMVTVLRYFLNATHIYA